MQSCLSPHSVCIHCVCMHGRIVYVCYVCEHVWCDNTWTRACLYCVSVCTVCLCALCTDTCKDVHCIKEYMLCTHVHIARVCNV